MLHREGRQYYALRIETDEPATGWEASFDGGATYVPAVEADGESRWLVNGPTFDPDSAPLAPSILIAANMRPLLRLIDNPEVIVHQGPAIILEG